MTLKHLFGIIVLISACSLYAADEARKPITRDGFLKAVEIGGLSSEELVSYVRDLGVDFQLQGDERQNLLGKGVDTRVLEAIERNYRYTLSPQEKEQVVAALSAGPPFTKEQFLGLLRMGTAQPILEEVVQRRKSGFGLGPEERKEIELAGAGPGLLNALAAYNTAAPAPKPKAVEAAPPPAPVAPPPINQAAAALFNRKVEPAQLLSRVQPQYPELAKRQRLSGTVKLELTINEKGRVESVKEISGNPLLLSLGANAVKQWRYAPAKIDGAPVTIVTQLELVFKLQ